MYKSPFLFSSYILLISVFNRLLNNNFAFSSYKKNYKEYKKRNKLQSTNYKGAIVMKLYTSFYLVQWRQNKVAFYAVEIRWDKGTKVQ